MLLVHIEDNIIVVGGGGVDAKPSTALLKLLRKLQSYYATAQLYTVQAYSYNVPI